MKLDENEKGRDGLKWQRKCWNKKKKRTKLFVARDCMESIQEEKMCLPLIRS